MTISDAVGAALRALPRDAGPDAAAEAVQAALVLCSRANRFIVTWCMKYMGYDCTYVGQKTPDGPPKFRDDAVGVVTDEPGAGVLAAFRVAEALVEHADNGGLLALEHPEAGMHESHVADCCELLVRCAVEATPPWAPALVQWSKAGAPKEFEEFMP